MQHRHENFQLGNSEITKSFQGNWQNKLRVLYLLFPAHHFGIKTNRSLERKREQGATKMLFTQCLKLNVWNAARHLHHSLATGAGMIIFRHNTQLYLWINNNAWANEGHRDDLCSSLLGLSPQSRARNSKSFKCNEQDGWKMGRVLGLN